MVRQWCHVRAPALPEAWMRPIVKGPIAARGTMCAVAPLGVPARRHDATGTLTSLGAGYTEHAPGTPPPVQTSPRHIAISAAPAAGRVGHVPAPLG